MAALWRSVFVVDIVLVLTPVAALALYSFILTLLLIFFLTFWDFAGMGPW